MAFAYSPKIVTDGLVLYLDAANPYSYISGASIATSLSISSSLSVPLSCSSLSSISYSATNGGSFIFNGINSQILIEQPSNQSSGIKLGFGTTPWVVNAWIKTTIFGANSLGTNAILANRSGGPAYSCLGIGAGGVLRYDHYSGSWLIESGSRPINDGNWHMVSWVNKNDNTMDLYVDGVFDKTIPSGITNQPNPVDMIGSSWASGWFLGSIANFSINQGILITQAQIQQNYNTLKGRFGR